MSDDLLDRIAPCFNKMGRLNSRALSPDYLARIGVADDIQVIIDTTPLETVQDCLRWVKAGRPKFPVCKVCGVVHARFDSDVCAEHRRESEVTKERRKATNRAKYGGDSPFSSPEVMEKSIATTREKHGVDFNSQREDIKADTTKTRMNTLKSRYGEDWARVLFKAAAERHGGVHPFADHKPVWTSKAETDIISALREIVPGTEIIQSDRKTLDGKEIDVWLPEYRLGIEHNGIVWHSEAMWEGKWSTAKHHVKDKTDLARAKGVTLLTIWDTEWNHRSQQIINFLAGRLGTFTTRMGARECDVVVDLDKQAASDFIDRYHIQPLPVNRIKAAVGLSYRGELVAVMTFGAHHRANRGEIVLNRLCSRAFHQVVAGASRLFSSACNHYGFDKVVSWSDERLSAGRVYGRLGFRRDALLPPAYSYVDASGTKLIPAQAATKTALAAKPDQTEHERAKELGMSRVWDAGKTRWVYERQ